MMCPEEAMFGTQAHARRSLFALVLTALLFAPEARDTHAQPESASGDARALEIAQEVMQALGGQEAWENTRFLSWRFFDRRQHYWDRWSGDVRIEDEEHVILMNINSRTGRAWVKGEEITAADSLQKLMDKGHAWWINDSYWVFMPYKLQDPGVNLRYVGERDMQDGRAADVIEMTFESVGRTPENKYEVCVDRETRLVGEWTFYRNADDAEASFTRPWADWKRVGRIMLAGDHGGDKEWKLASYDELPRSVFENPDPVQLENAAR
jgi:hypothetical protein